MPRIARQPSETGFYHVIMRGSGQRRIFESGSDKKHYLSLLKRAVESDGLCVFAWCLMDNHIHLALKADAGHLAHGMHRVNTAYAKHFNGIHGHVGPVFQERYASYPIASDSYLLDVVRYIHLNPLDTGKVDIRTFQWSSYLEYRCTHDHGLCDTSLVLEMLGGTEAFEEFHDVPDAKFQLVQFGSSHPRMSDAEAVDLAKRHFGTQFSDLIPRMTRLKRDAAILKLYQLGISKAQIGRLTGIGRGIIARATTRKSVHWGRG